MGNCCGRQRPQLGQTNQVNKHTDQRLRTWKATGTISLRDANLKELPDTVRVAGPEARQLDATNNRLTALPDHVLHFARLERLLLGTNQLATLPTNLGDLKQLKMLILDDNALAFLPESTGSLLHLERLSVAGNVLTQLPSSIGRLKKLVSLNAGRNKLTALPSSLGGCIALEDIDAADNYLQVIPADLSSLKRLKLLKLDKNRIAAVPSAILQKCSTLQTLSLHNNPITPEVLQDTDGYAAFEARRKHKADKVVASGVLLGERTMDVGVSR